MNKILAINIKSDLGSFQRPQTNNSPSTFNIMPKSALIGIIGAVVGLDRTFMKDNDVYKILSNEIKYSLVLKSPFNLKSWSEYGYNPDKKTYSPLKFERLENINYDVYILFNDENEFLNDILNNFIDNVKNNVSSFSPYMGMANFLADIDFIDIYEKPIFENGEFMTSGFCTKIIMNDKQEYNKLIVENIPTRNNGYLMFDQNSYKEIYFHLHQGIIYAEGEYCEINSFALEFI